MEVIVDSIISPICSELRAIKIEHSMCTLPSLAYDFGSIEQQIFSILCVFRMSIERDFSRHYCTVFIGLVTLIPPDSDTDVHEQALMVSNETERPVQIISFTDLLVHDHHTRDRLVSPSPFVSSRVRGLCPSLFM